MPPTHAVGHLILGPRGELVATLISSFIASRIRANAILKLILKLISFVRSPRVARATARLGGLSGVCFLLSVLGLLGWRSHRQAEVAASLAIHSSGGIDESRFVKIGGIDQWVQIRGESSANPVLLVLHGGPGASFIPYTRLFREWERHFTVVLWDQRGTGQTYTRNTLPDSRTMTIDRMTADGLEITAYLRARLHQDRIMLLAHSWGSVLGVGMVATRPGWYSAFVGTGFIVSELPDWVAAFDILLANVRAAGDETALRALTAIGPRPMWTPMRRKSMTGGFTDTTPWKRKTCPRWRACLRSHIRVIP